MKGFLKVICHNCAKQFWKDKGHVNENFKLGHGFYCSRKCLTKHKTLGKILSCENPKCNNKFYRAPKDMSVHNYCSSSCATIINNLRYPKWPKRYCAACGKEFKNRASKYCSSKCGWSALYNNRGHIATKYIPEEIQKAIKQLAKQLGRSPSRRELGNMSYAAIRSFGSWNKAMETADLVPHRSHDHQMYRRTRTKALDGHVCDSISEALIDNWLTQNNIPHTRDTHYPTTNHRADWSIKNGKVFVEYFGLAKDSPRYDRAVKEKQKICKKNHIRLIEVYPSDLYPKMSLDGKLALLK